MDDDLELLRRYAEQGSESAFAELVQRRLNLVYSVALRQVGGDAHLAADVSQLVFIALARKARQLSDRSALTGWLCQVAQFTAADVVRSERRRRGREEEAQTMQTSDSNPNASLDWDRLRPLLDQALNELPDRERDAIALRYFEQKTYAEIAERLETTEDGVRKRIERTLDKLSAQLGRRGVTSAASAVAAALAGQAGIAAPTGLATAISGTAVAAAASSVGTGGIVVLMTATKTQIGLAAALLVLTAGGLYLQLRTNSRLREELRFLGSADSQRAKPAAPQPAAGASLPRRDYSADMARLDLEERSLNARLAEARAAAAAVEKWRLAPVYDVANLDVPPVARTQGPPQYPLEMRRAGMSGQAEIEFVVDAEGVVRDATVVSFSAPGFDKAAIEAISRWNYSAGMLKELPVNARTRTTIKFNVPRQIAAPGGALKPSSWF